MEELLPSLPFRVEIEVTGKCNLSCANCYAQPLSGFEPGFNGLTYIMQKTKDEANPFEVSLLGGEPFMRTDIIQVLNKAKNLFGSIVGVSTNGTKFTTMPASDLDKLKEISDGTSFVQVSIDSLKPTINEVLRGRTAEVLKGINILERHEIPFSVSIVVSKQNLGDTLNTIKTLATDMQYAYSFNLNPIQLPNSNGNRHNLMVSSQEMSELVKEARQVVSASGKIIKAMGLDKPCEYFAPALLDSYRLNTCLAGVFRACVLPDGNVSPCSLIRNGNLGNLYTESWRNIWARSAERFKTLKGLQCESDNLTMLRVKGSEVSRVRSR